MKAIILNSGIGKRMGELVKDNPKCLIEIDESETILGRQLKKLSKFNLREIIITTGPFKEKIEDYVKKNFPGLKVKYVHNPRFNSTNYIYSLFLTKTLINDDIFLIHGDMVFEDEILNSLLNSKDKNAVMINNKIEPPQKDFKARIENNRVKEIGVNVFGENCFFLAPMYKFSKESFLEWLKIIEEFIEKGKVSVYAEDAFNTISNIIELKPVYFSDKRCMELDTPEDIAYFNKLINQK